MNTLLLESTIFAGLPKHWIRYLAQRHGKNYPFDGAGEHSEIISMKAIDPIKMRNILKDDNNMAIIGRLKNTPLFMISKDSSYQSKYFIFEVNPGQGSYNSRGDVKYYNGYKHTRRPSPAKDSYTINDVIEILDKMVNDKGGKYDNLTLEVITKDPIRKELIDKRKNIKNIEDPLNTWDGNSPSIAQKQRSKKYAEIKKAKLDKLIEIQKQKIKTQINSSIEEFLNQAVDKVKRGYTYSINKEELGKMLLQNINISNIQRIASAYSALSYSYKTPYDTYSNIKKLNLPI